MERIEHREEKWQFPFVEYSPKTKKAKMPVIIQLHGAGERGDGNESLVLVDRYGFSKIICDREIDCIFVMPQCPEENFWAGRVESLIKFVEDVIEYYDADPDRIYLTGSSMGGFGTWFLAMARPDLFAAIAPVCGGGMGWNAKVLTMPVWAFHGDKDGTVNIMYSEDMIKRLLKYNEQNKYTVFEGAGHGIQSLSYTTELLDWLLSKKRMR